MSTTWSPNKIMDAFTTFKDLQCGLNFYERGGHAKEGRQIVFNFVFVFFLVSLNI